MDTLLEKERKRYHMINITIDYYLIYIYLIFVDEEYFDLRRWKAGKILDSEITRK